MSKPVQALTDRSLPGIAAHDVIPASALRPEPAATPPACNCHPHSFRQYAHSKVYALRAYHSAQGTSAFVHKSYDIDQPPWERCLKPLRALGNIMSSLFLSLEVLTRKRDF